MAKVFHKSRMAQLTQSRFSKYVLYALGEIILVVIGILIAVSINKWNERQKKAEIEVQLLDEIATELRGDLIDIQHNVAGHGYGLKACEYWTDVVNGSEVNQDSIWFYYKYITRDFTLLQYRAGYESLKSQGLSIVRDDSVRIGIISLYEFYYNSQMKLEETYYETQFQRNYFEDFNRLVSPYLKFDEAGDLIGVEHPLPMSDIDKNLIRSYIYKIRTSRHFVLRHYKDTEARVLRLLNRLESK